MTFTPDQNKLLAQPLDPKHVVKPTGSFGAKGDYIEGWHAIAEANRIFGHDGWSYTIQLIQDALVHGEDSKKQPQWQAAYTCLCTVIAGGVTRQDVGFGSGFAKQVGDAIEGATKEAATDALKRALRTFGHPFGLALYDKKRTHVQAPEKEAPPADALITEDQRSWLAGRIDASGVPIADVCHHFEIQSLKELTFGRAQEVNTWLKTQRKAA
jgi:DNA recombination protein Rad52